MTRKTNGNGSLIRGKKTLAAMVEPPSGQALPDVRKSMKTFDLDEQIRRRAYEIYLERQGAAGDEHQDWLVAEREIRGRRQPGYSA